MNKMVLLMMYGFYSLGMLVGVGVGMVLMVFGVLVMVYILLVVLVGIVFIYIVIQVIFDGMGKNVVDGIQYGEKGVFFYCDIQLLLIGVVVLVMVFVEGFVNDWLFLLMVDGYGFSFIFGLLIYVGFILGMIVGCFIGGWFIDCYSCVVVVWVSVLMGVLGIGLIIFVDSVWVVGVFVVFWGMGVLLGFLLIIFVVSDIGFDVLICVSVVVMIGYLVFFVGLLLLGYFGEYYGLCSVMLVVLVLVIFVVIVVKVVVKFDIKMQMVMENS